MMRAWWTSKIKDAATHLNRLPRQVNESLGNYLRIKNNTLSLKNNSKRENEAKILFSGAKD